MKRTPPLTCGQGKRKSKNSIGLTGGFERPSGSFVGLTYETNNFLGLGETPPCKGSVGNRRTQPAVWFTEHICSTAPALGFTVYDRRFGLQSGATGAKSPPDKG